MPANDLTRARYNRALDRRNQVIASQLVLTARHRAWPSRHLMGLHGKPVPFHKAQDIAYNSTSKIVAMIAGSQGGKALAIDTPIPTPNGFVSMGDISVGDTVYSEIGEPCTVLRVTRIKHGHDCYRITFDDGNEIIADEDHLWQTQTRKQRKNQARRKPENKKWIKNRRQCQVTDDYSINTTAELFQSIQSLPKSNWSEYSVDICGAASFPEKDLLIPPYTLGAWLGDGASKGAILYCADDEIIENIKKDGIVVSDGDIVKNQGKAKTYRLGVVEIRKEQPGRVNTFSEKLRWLNLIGNKHIPEVYLFGSIEQRIALLRGLMDTDGYTDKNKNGMCEFTTINPTLANDVRTLVQSLGIKCRVVSGEAKLNGKDCGQKYRITFLARFPVFGISRKSNYQYPPQKPLKKNTKRRYIRSIEKVESVPVKCIQVDSKNSLYLCGNAFVPTHNTAFLPWWLAAEIERTAAPDGNNDYIVITSSYDLFKLKLLPAVLQTFEQILGIGRFWAGDKIIELKNPHTGLFEASKSTDVMWGRIILRSASSMGGLESATARAACLDEAGQDEFSLRAYQAIERRLRLFRGRQLITTTLYNLGWVKSQIVDRAIKGGEQYHEKIGDADLTVTENKQAGITLLQYDSILNPEFSVDEFREAEATMAADEFQMFYKGQVAKLRSIIYDCFDSEKHVIPHFPIPRGWPKGFIGIDPIGQMTAAVWIAFDPENNKLHIYREYEQPFGISTYGHVNAILKLCIEDGEVLRVIGGGPSENQARVDWTSAGLPMSACPITDVWVQIRKVYALLKDDAILVHDNCPRIISDFGMMKRETDRSGNLTDKIEDKDTWHLLDALRYLIGWLSVAGDEVEEIVYNRISIAG